MSENEKALNAKKRILLLAQNIQAHLDYPKILKFLYKCATEERKNIRNGKFELSAQNKTEVCHLADNVWALSRQLCTTKKIAEYRICEEQLAELISDLEKELNSVLKENAVAKAAENLSTVAGQAASVVFEKAKTAVTEGIKTIKKKIEND